MLRSSASKVGGFTLAESLIVVAIVGILVAIAFPSLKAAIDRANLTQATDMVVGSLQQAQREAMRRDRGCTLTLDKVARKIVGDRGCLLDGDRYLPAAISIEYTGADGEIQYGIRGNTTTNKTVILSIRDSPKNTRCLTVSAPLGIIRLGTYNAIADTCRKLS
ncbi:prepilin-type N-terminal cleavage/methylation domain-containing protein [Chamaesiphon sp. VAR_69_metabat_338]|uniref:pilus assembly FimT family protein n=1 Tax=Chamaesiphon sp. VAR_69_metabat_338 TaxID=2964704 RepID=UPI00286D8602|nr:prepilin-type N-terminal cleavage/methylation domain-containing protein [Chamaesiphon sp. VAR_69_metabat_338]